MQNSYTILFLLVSLWLLVHFLSHPWYIYSTSSTILYLLVSLWLLVHFFLSHPWYFCSTSQLRRLCLVCCYYITDKKLSELAAKLPLLEELDMTISSTSEELLKALKAFGRYCPLLKSLKWNQLWDGQPRIRIEGDEEFDDDDEALAIAKNVPELRHLLLNGNRVTNDGLQAILDGCPHLESLDLRKCFNVTLSGNLGKRCAERIKNLRHPNDSTHDYGIVAEISNYGPFDEDDFFFFFF